jgi:hypothetical protein
MFTTVMVGPIFVSSKTDSTQLKRTLVLDIDQAIPPFL